ncbi:MAG: type III-A CRISPR-associated RAMP protein Csm5 [Deltaproteobacteria bacterium]|nr:type III-A CRISPR-associated RAMP protein Csm5 [Deltaproteobacteria bacterium]
MKEPIKFYIQTISPVHIGCDEFYEPTGFVLDENAWQMIVFDPLSFISQMEDSDKAEFSQICAKGTIASILEIYKFMQNKTAEGRMIDVCPDFLEHYKQTLSFPMRNPREIQQNLNSFAIPRTAFRSVDQRPYIPGSTIKGALRTAYLNLMEREKKLSEKGKKRNARNLEQCLMEYNGIPTDPFRMVKVSDFMPVGETRTRIVYGINKKKKPSAREARGMPLIFEVIQPGSVFVGTIAVDSPLPGSGIRKSVSMEKLLDSSTLFYANEKERETKELSNVGVKVIFDNTRFQDNKNSFLVRIGRHSGAESVTIEGHRNIKIMMGKGEKPKYIGHATTLWLASETRKPASLANLQPFGWVQLSRLTDDLSEEFQIKKQEWQEKENKHQEISQAETERKAEVIRQANEEAKKLKLEAEKRRKEEERKKAELADMSPEERDITSLSMSNISDEKVGAIYNRIDSFSPEKKIEVARKIKEWRIKKKIWTGQKKAQLKKVRKIKQILNEV